MKPLKNNTLMSKLLPCALLLAFVFWGTACSDTALSPGKNHNNNNNNKKTKTKPTPTSFSPMVITISGIGTNHMTASAKPLNSLPALRGTASIPSDGDGSHGTDEGTIKMDEVSVGSFTIGDRPDPGSAYQTPIEGWRYFFATYKVKNADQSGVGYNTARKNLTFVATNVKTGTNTTNGISAILILKNFAKDEITTNAIWLSQHIIPTGEAYLSPAGTIASAGPDILQVYTDSKITSIEGNININTSERELLPYGFVVHTSNPGSRKMPVSNKYNGRVTFAFKVPLTTDPHNDPFKIKAIFTPIDQENTVITQSFEEQTPMGYIAFANRVHALDVGSSGPVDRINLLPGSGYNLNGPNVHLLCGNILVAGNTSDPTYLVPVDANRISSIPKRVLVGTTAAITGCVEGATLKIVGLPGTFTPVNNPTGNHKVTALIPKYAPPGKYTLKLKKNGHTSTAQARLTAVTINEFLADPTGAGDANQSGSVSSNGDEFIEIVNNSSSQVDISGWTLWDETGKNFTFPSGTKLNAGQAAVVFGGSGAPGNVDDNQPNSNFGGSIVYNSSGLSLNNSDDAVILKDKQDHIISKYVYGDPASDESVTRSPDITGDFVAYHNAQGAQSGVNFTPGTRNDGTTF